MPEVFAAVLARAGYGSALINTSFDEVRGGEGRKLSGLLQQGVKGKSVRYLPGKQKPSAALSAANDTMRDKV